MPIVVAPLQKDLVVIKVLADEKTRKHLANLGLTVDSTVQVLSHSGGSVILFVKEGKLALDKNLSTKILVRVA